MHARIGWNPLGEDSARHAERARSHLDAVGRRGSLLFNYQLRLPTKFDEFSSREPCLRMRAIPSQG